VACQESRARLDEDKQDKFYSKLKKQGLKTCASISIEHKSKNSRDIIVLKADRNYLPTKWHLDPSSRLATTDMG